MLENAAGILYDDTAMRAAASVCAPPFAFLHFPRGLSGFARSQ